MKKPIETPVVYHDDICDTYWEKWLNFKSHMIEEHKIDEDMFVNKDSTENQ